MHGCAQVHNFFCAKKNTRVILSVRKKTRVVFSDVMMLTIMMRVLGAERARNLQVDERANAHAQHGNAERGYVRTLALRFRSGRPCCSHGN